MSDLCTFCGVRARREVEPLHRNDHDASYCEDCHRASQFVNTSVQDAAHGIKEANVDQVYMAALMEFKSGRRRRVLMQMLERRLRACGLCHEDLTCWARKQVEGKR